MLRCGMLHVWEALNRTYGSIKGALEKMPSLWPELGPLEERRSWKKRKPQSQPSLPPFRSPLGSATRRVCCVLALPCDSAEELVSEDTGRSEFDQGSGKFVGKSLLSFCVVKVTNKVEIEEKFQLSKEGVPTLTKSLTCEV